MADSNTTVTVRPPVWALIAAVAIGGLFYIYGKKLEARPQPQMPPSITVTGEGKVSASPDIAEMTFGVSTGRKQTAKAAIDSLTTSMNAVIDATKKAGIDAKDITTEYFSLNPEYDYTTSGQIPRGFSASQSLRVKVRDLDKVGDVLTAVTNAGANQAGNVQFTIDDPEKATADARQEAIDKARARAQTIANQLGLRLGKVTSFSEGGNYSPPVYMYDRAAMGAVANETKSLSLPAGEQDVQTTVTITYELL